MRIVIDMQGAQTESRFRGIGRYTLSFAEGVARNRGEHEVFLALSGLFPDTIEPIRAAFDRLLPQENIRVWYAPWPVLEHDPANFWRRQVAELMREAFLATLRPDVIHISSLFEGYNDDAVTSIGQFDQDTPVSVSLYDLIPLLNPDQYLKPNPNYRRYYEQKIGHLARANLMLAISDFSRQEGLECLDVIPEKIVNVSTAIEDRFLPLKVSEEDSIALKTKFKITRAFILYTGGADERKNIPRLIQAYSCLTPELRKLYQLVLVGRITPVDVENLRHHAKQYGVASEELVFVGYASDEELVRLYNLCSLFVFPSWHEGFGLPALEAMACGAPVIGANTSSLPEVIGLTEALFDPFDVSSIVAKMSQALEDEEFLEKLRVHGAGQAMRFSWDVCAREAISAFERIHDRVRNVVSLAVSGQEITWRLLRAIAGVKGTFEASENEIADISALIARNHPEPGRQRRIFVDISELIQRDAKTGIQRVTRAILTELLSVPPDGYVVQAVYSVAGSMEYRIAEAFVNKLHREDSEGSRDEVIEPQPGDVFLGLDLQQNIVIECKDYYRFLRSHGVRVFFVVYDLLPILLPSAFPSGTGQLHTKWLEVVAEADGAVCISKAVANELHAWIDSNRCDTFRPLSIHWFHLGADLENSVPTTGCPENSAEILQLLGSIPTFLMVGTIEPRKGHSQVLRAFDSLWKGGEDVGLAIIGKNGWGVEEVVDSIRNNEEFGRRLFWLEEVSDEFLKEIFSVSACLLAASEGEGFGLPLIEAARHGLPIVARSIPVFREIAGDKAFYFNAVSPEELASSLRKWLDLRAMGGLPLSEDVKCLTWAESTNQLLEIIIGKGRSPQVRKDLELARMSQYSCHSQDGDRPPRVLQLCPYPIRKPCHGGQLRSDAIRKKLSNAGFDVSTIGFYQTEAYERSELDKWDIGFPADSAYRRYRGECIPALSDFLMASYAVNDDAALKKITAVIDRDFDVILVEQPWFFPLAKRLQNESVRCRQSVLVFSSQNIEAPMKRKVLETSVDAVILDEAIEEISVMERKAASDADLTIAVTAQDAEILRGYGAKNVLLAPNGIMPCVVNSERVEYWRSVLPSIPWPIFIASAHPPNYQGFLEVVGESLACIPPGSRLVVAGGVGSHLKESLLSSRWGTMNIARLQVLGVLDEVDLCAVKSLAHVFVLPIAAGGGSNIKTAEALYSGRSVVCTSTALRGFGEYGSFPGLWVADTPQEFQSALRSALGTDSGAEVEQEMHLKLRQKLTWEYSLDAIPQAISQIITARQAAAK